MIDGSFEQPPLARLAAEDQVFVAGFVRCHGSIKQMEAFSQAPGRPSLGDLLSGIERGEITAADAISQLRSDDADDK